ncbi:MAG: methylmalonyl-CoA mutase, partial [Candidatus Nephthysia bennettiae]
MNLGAGRDRSGEGRDVAGARVRDDGVATSTISGIEIGPLYTSADLRADVEQKPAEFPYTRGIHQSGYRGRLWTMRQ